MTFHRVGARLLAGAQTVVEMTPVIGADFAGVDVRRFNRIDVAEHLLDLGQPSIFNRMSPPGRTKGSV